MPCLNWALFEIAFVPVRGHFWNKESFDIKEFGHANPHFSKVPELAFTSSYRHDSTTDRRPLPRSTIDLDGFRANLRLLKILCSFIKLSILPRFSQNRGKKSSQTGEGLFKLWQTWSTPSISVPEITSVAIDSGTEANEKGNSLPHLDDLNRESMYWREEWVTNFSSRWTLSRLYRSRSLRRNTLSNFNEI